MCLDLPVQYCHLSVSEPNVWFGSSVLQNYQNLVQQVIKVFKIRMMWKLEQDSYRAVEGKIWNGGWGKSEFSQFKAERVLSGSHIYPKYLRCSAVTSSEATTLVSSAYYIVPLHLTIF